jgi:hypothetical protein
MPAAVIDWVCIKVQVFHWATVQLMRRRLILPYALVCEACDPHLWSYNAHLKCYGSVSHMKCNRLTVARINTISTTNNERRPAVIGNGFCLLALSTGHDQTSLRDRRAVMTLTWTLTCRGWRHIWMCWSRFAASSLLGLLQDPSHDDCACQLYSCR